MDFSLKGFLCITLVLRRVLVLQCIHSFHAGFIRVHPRAAAAKEYAND